MSETKPAIFIPGDTGEVSDGYHTFNELYDHRCALFLAFIRSSHCKSWKSRTHHDGKGWGGWFIVGLELPTGTISYHLPDKLWDVADFIPTRERAPEWDGHTPAMVVERILAWVNR